jgi:hypothetical protein
MKEATAGSERERHLLFSPFIFLPHAVVKRRSLPQIFFSLLPDVLLCGTIK